jgi:hypothetical protein
MGDSNSASRDLTLHPQTLPILLRIAVTSTFADRAQGNKATSSTCRERPSNKPAFNHPAAAVFKLVFYQHRASTCQSRKCHSYHRPYHHSHHRRHSRPLSFHGRPCCVRSTNHAEPEVIHQIDRCTSLLQRFHHELRAFAISSHLILYNHHAALLLQHGICRCTSSSSPTIPTYPRPSALSTCLSSPDSAPKGLVATLLPAHCLGAALPPKIPRCSAHLITIP